MRGQAAANTSDETLGNVMETYAMLLLRRCVFREVAGVLFIWPGTREQLS